MRVITSLSGADVAQPSIVSIGNFDGVHLGHQEILRTVVGRARALGLRPVAMTFSPHPVRFLAPDRAPPLISTLEQKIRLIESTGIDLLVIVNFDGPFSRLSPEDFIRQYLQAGLHARSVCVGSNFNFGYKGAGSVETLRQFEPGLEVVEVQPVRVRGTVAGSSRIRALIAAGSVSRACRLLGRWFQLEGSIVPGAGRGRSVTVPTLNLKADNELLPKVGVYITRISVDGMPFSNSITNVGMRPTFDESDLTIETFVLNDPVPPGSRTARLDFLRRLRDEVKFDTAESLRRQISADTSSAQRFFRFFAP
jgi:riboflavin kinase / FMN adenylyltransferase